MRDHRDAFRARVTSTVTPKIVRDGHLLADDDVPPAVRRQADALIAEVRSAVDAHHAPDPF